MNRIGWSKMAVDILSEGGKMQFVPTQLVEKGGHAGREGRDWYKEDFKNNLLHLHQESLKQIFDSK